MLFFFFLIRKALPYITFPFALDARKLKAKRDA